MSKNALIVGAGEGISASFARTLAADGYTIALASRTPDKIGGWADEIGATRHACDVSDPASVTALFEAVTGELDVVLFNPSARERGPFAELTPEGVKKALDVGAYGGFLVGQAAAQRMLARSGGPSGAIFFTGASASVKGYPMSAPFAMAKFALRGMAQSMARELAPKNIHIAHFVIDGAVMSAKNPASADNPDALLDPDAIAHSYMAVLNQPRSAWSWEIELRPWVEKF